MNGQLGLFCVNSKGIYISVTDNGYSFIYSINHDGSNRHLLKECKGKIGSLVADEDNVFYCLSKNHSNYYYKGYRLSLDTESDHLIDIDEEDYINEYIVCASSYGVYYTTNKFCVDNNSIIYRDKEGLSKVLKMGKDGLLVFLDYSPDRQGYCYASIHSNTQSDIYCWDPKSGEFKINDSSLKSVNYDARYLNEHFLVYITNENQNKQYLGGYDLRKKKKKVIYLSELGDIDSFCIDKKKNGVYIKVMRGVRDYLFFYGFEYGVEQISLPEKTMVINSMVVHDGDLYIVAENERRKPSLYRKNVNGWKTVVSFGSYKFGYNGKVASLLTCQYWLMEMMLYETLAIKKGCVLWLHGGPNAANRHVYNQLFTFFLREGFDIIAPNFAGSTCYGKAYRELLSTKGEKACDLIVEQCRDAISWYNENIKSENNQIVVCGESFGGYISFCIAKEEIANIRLCINLFGPVCLHNAVSSIPGYMREISKKSFMFQQEDEDSMLLEKLKGLEEVKLLLICGEDDVYKLEGERNIGNLEVVNIKNCGHGCDSVDDYYLITDSIKKYLNSL